MQLLLAQNAEMSNKIASLENENNEMKKRSEEAKERVDAKVLELTKENSNMSEGIEEMIKSIEDLGKEGWRSYSDVEWFFKDEKLKDLIRMTMGEEEAREFKTEIKIEPYEETDEDVSRFESTGREERMDMVFGQDGDFTAKTLRRFIEKFKVIKW